LPCLPSVGHGGLPVSENQTPWAGAGSARRKKMRANDGEIETEAGEDMFSRAGVAAE